MDLLLTKTAFYIYSIALVFTMMRVLVPKLTPWVPIGMISVGASLQLFAIITRWVEIQWAPVTTLYEILVALCFGFALAIAVTFRKHDYPWLASLSVVLLVATLGYALFGQDTNTKDVVPGLQSNWMPIHVGSWIFSYCAFTVGFVVCVGLLALRRLGLRPDLQANLSDLFHKLVLFGFPFHTLGLITGAIWAKSAWASPWFHDAKEWAAAITWLIYAVYLHLYRKGSKGADWLGILGMASVIFAFVGVNYIPSATKSAHTYVSPGDPDSTPLIWVVAPFILITVALWLIGYWKNGVHSQTLKQHGQT
jgi:ABC-type transport system involved in cytochrome c biogenesis permease subunit